MQTLSLLAVGADNALMAKSMHVSVDTVKTRLKVLNRVTGSSTRTGLVAYAYQRRIFRPDLEYLRPQLRIGERERQVLALAAQGLTRNDIAVKLDMAPLTVKAHLAHIARRWQVRGTTATVALAVRAGVILT